MKQILLFSGVGITSGIVNLGVYNGVLFALRALGLFSGFDFLIAQAFGFFLSVAWSYLLNRRFVFTSPEERAVPWYSALIKMYVTYAATGIGLSSLLSLVWVYVLHIPKEILTVLNDTLCFPVNYLLVKYWSFKKS
jgi:putative flippase GtrA